MKMESFKKAGTAMLAGFGTLAMTAGAAWAQAEVRKVVAASGGRVLEQGLSFAKAANRVDAAGRIKADDDVRAELTTLLEQLVELVRTPLDSDD